MATDLNLQRRDPKRRDLSSHSTIRMFVTVREYPEVAAKLYVLRSPLGFLQDRSGLALMPAEGARFWTEHSDRSGLDGWCAALVVGSAATPPAAAMARLAEIGFRVLKVVQPAVLSQAAPPLLPSATPSAGGRRCKAYQ